MTHRYEQDDITKITSPSHANYSSVVFNDTAYCSCGFSFESVAKAEPETRNIRTGHLSDPDSGNTYCGIPREEIKDTHETVNFENLSDESYVCVTCVYKVVEQRDFMAQLLSDIQGRVTDINQMMNNRHHEYEKIVSD